MSDHSFLILLNLFPILFLMYTKYEVAIVIEISIVISEVIFGVESECRSLRNLRFIFFNRRYVRLEKLK